ncbi:uncharacterized protein LOC108111779 [Drosophila eugracilis]|uniref:uncharacterized protein LOC108111779 n=1 Tax=Drosophila eugracilis TaxID=29029 RepID=UPI0007E71C02|nr:uncharacterized protein LOC108111779 [Drosophila eugracilis]
MSSLPTKSWTIQIRDLATSPFAIIALTCVLGYVAYMKTRRQYGTYDDEDYEKEGHRKLPAPLTGLRLNRKQLANYNSDRPDKTYLIALFDVIYDVSSAPHDFGPSGRFAKLAGTEVSHYIRKQAFFEMRDYESYLKEWQLMLADFFYRAGLLIDGDNEVSGDNLKKMDSISEEVEEKAELVSESEEGKAKGEPITKSELKPEKEPKLKIPELSIHDVCPLDEGINSDCESLCTAYDFLPGHDDRADEEDDDDDEDENDDNEESPKAGQGDNNGDVFNDLTMTDAVSNQTMWNEADVTMVPIS